MEKVVKTNEQRKESIIVRADRKVQEIFEKAGLPKGLWKIFKVTVGVAVIATLILMELMGGGSPAGNVVRVADDIRRKKEEEAAYANYLLEKERL